MIRIALSVLAAGLLLPVPAAAQHSAIPCFDPDFGTNLNLGNDQTVAISLPFTFMFPGGPSNTISVCSNGFLWVGTNLAAPAVPSVTDFLVQPARIAPLWVDLDPTDPSSGGVWARVTNSRAVITWKHLRIAGSYLSATVQAQLLPDGTVIIDYDPVIEPDRAILFGVKGAVRTPHAIDLSSSMDAPLDTGVQPNCHELFQNGVGFDLRNRTFQLTPNPRGGYLVSERAQCHALHAVDRSARQHPQWPAAWSSTLGPNLGAGYYDATRGTTVFNAHEWDGRAFSAKALAAVLAYSTPNSRFACPDPSQPGAGWFFVSPSHGALTNHWRSARANWTATPSPFPTPREYWAGAFDSGRQRMVFYGGRSPTSPAVFYPETYESDGTVATLVPTLNHPPADYFSAYAMAYDSGRGRMVLLVDRDWIQPSPFEHWEYHAGDWHRLNIPTPFGVEVWSMAFDAGRSRTVTVLDNIVWEFDGTSWQQGPAAPALVTTLVYDSARREILTFGWRATDPVLAWNGIAWSVRNPAPAAPPPRSEAVASHDPGPGTVVVFGGRGAGGQVLDETWLWNGQSWRDRTGAAGSPGARSNAAMTWLPAGARGRPATTVLHAGVGTQSNPLGDTWALDAAGTWQPLTTSGRTPPARYDHAMVATDGGLLILFGGSAGLAGFLGDTWELDDLSQWANTSPVTAPPARDQHAMAWDSVRGRAVLFGGRGQGGIGTVLADTWEYDPVTNVWTDVTPAGGSPPGRWNHSLVYDPRRARTVLFGGGNGFSGLYDDVWEWDGVRWIARGFDSLPPTPAWQMATTWDATNQRIFAFGGEAIYGTPQSATWEITAYEDRVTFDRENYQPLQVTGVPIAAPGFPTALKAEFAQPNILGFALLDFGPRAAPYAQIPVPLGCAPDNVWPTPLWTGVFVGSRAFVNVPLPYFAELPSVTFWLQGLFADGNCLRVTEARAVLCRS